MHVKIYTVCFILACFGLDVNSDENNQNGLEKIIIEMELSLKADIRLLREEMKANTEQLTTTVDLLNQTMQLTNCRNEGKFAEKAAQIKTSIETIETGLHLSVIRAEQFLNKSVENIQSEIGSKFHEIQNLNKATQQETKENSDKTIVSMLQSLESNMEKLSDDVSLIKLVTVSGTLEMNPLQNAHASCNGTDAVTIGRCDFFIWFGNEIKMGPLIQKDTRLSNMSTIKNGVQGRLEVFYRGEWGTVCDDNFEDIDATVACKHLGYMNGTSHANHSTDLAPAVFGQGKGKIWMYSVSCTGSESSLFQCPMSKLGLHYCKHNEDVGVSCFS